MKTYSASLDRLAIGITFFVGAIFLGQAVLFVYLSATEPYRDEVGWMGPMIPVVSVFGFLLLYAYRIKGYDVSAESILIRRPWFSKTIPLRHIRSVAIPSENDMKWTLRLFANGGVFGYTGIFTNPVFGRMRWYATRRTGLMMLETVTGEKIVLTPDDLSLADAIRSAIQLPTSTS